MKEVVLVKKPNFNYKEYVKRSALATDFAQLYKESVILVEDDKPKIVYLELDFDCSDLVEELKKIGYNTSKRSNGLISTSKIFGYQPKVPFRRDFCTIAALAGENPKAHALILDYAKKIAALYEKHAPEKYQEHFKMTKEKILQDYQIENSPFTSGIVNKNNPLKYHFDAGNFKNVYSAMIAFKKHVGGGYLALPEYDIGLEIADNSLLLFDGQQILHGVTPIQKLSSQAYRYSIVFYSLQQMWKCETIDKEIARIRNVKMEREAKRLK